MVPCGYFRKHFKVYGHCHLYNGFFGFLQVLRKKKIQVSNKELKAIILTRWRDLFNRSSISQRSLCPIRCCSIQVLLQWFIAWRFTFAQYARKGFFELLFVSMINLSITVLILTFVNQTGKSAKNNSIHVNPFDFNNLCHLNFRFSAHADV